jgi:MFS family permease
MSRVAGCQRNKLFTPAQHRGFYGSWQMVGQGLAGLTGALLGTFIMRTFTPEALDSWGWRVPFLFGLVIGPLGLGCPSSEILRQEAA